MKRQSLVLLAMAIVAAGAAGCFKDPVSGLRSGPSLLSLDRTDVYLLTGDSVAVVAELKDNQGNVLPATGANWVSADPLVAAVRLDDAVVPGTYYTRGFIRAVTVTGGLTTVTLTTRNVQTTIRVVVMPANVHATVISRTGAAQTDTVVYPALIGPPAVPITSVPFSAPDTLVIAGTSVLNFDTSQVSVYSTSTAGVFNGSIVAKTPTQLKVVFSSAAVGRLVVKHLKLVTGNAAVGTMVLDSLMSDSVAIARARFRGAITQLGDTMTINAGANQSFSAATGASFGAATGIVLSQTATALSVLSPVAYSGQVTVTNVKMGLATLSLTTNAVAPFAMNAATFPAANVDLGTNARLGDTITVSAPTGLTFSTTGTVSQVLVGNTAMAQSDTAWILSRTASTIKAFAKRGGSGKVTVTRLILGSGAVIPLLSTPAAMAIDSMLSDFSVANTEGVAHAMVIPAGNVDTVYGAVNASTLPNDFWTFTTTASFKLYGQIAWFGSGNPYGSGTNTPAYTSDIDLIICSVGMACDESVPDLLGYAAATATQPEQGTTTAAKPAAQYFVNVIPFTGPYTVVYRLIIGLQ